jgi:hypothetical protein
VYPRLSPLQAAGTPRDEKENEKSIDPPLPCCVGRMYVQWREREHEAANELVAADPNVMAVLTQCGLVKFFLCPFMRAQPRLLNALVDYWHPDAEAFHDRGEILGAHHRGYLLFDGPLEERGTRQLSDFSCGAEQSLGVDRGVL